MKIESENPKKMKKIDRGLEQLNFLFSDYLGEDLVSDIYYENGCNFVFTKEQLSILTEKEDIKPLPESPLVGKKSPEMLQKELDDKFLGQPLQDKKERETRRLMEMFPSFSHFMEMLYEESGGKIEECLEILLLLSKNEDFESDQGGENVSKKMDEIVHKKISLDERKPKKTKKVRRKKWVRIDDVFLTKFDEKKHQEKRNMNETKEFSIEEHLKEAKKFEQNLKVLKEMFPKSSKKILSELLIDENNDVNKAIEKLIHFNDDIPSSTRKWEKKRKNPVKTVYAHKNSRHKNSVKTVYAKIPLKKLIQLSLSYEIDIKNVMDIFNRCNRDGNKAFQYIQEKYRKVQPKYNNYKGSTPNGKNNSFQRVSRYNTEYDELLKKIKNHEEKKEFFYSRAIKSMIKGKEELSTKYTLQGKEEEREVKRLKKMANGMTFEKSNHGIWNLKKIDLHGLIVTEALHVLREHIGNCKRKRVRQFEVVTGKGLHSKNTAKIKPAVKRFLKEENFKFKPSSNKGGFRVFL